MSNQETSRCYSDATRNMHASITSLYESLHNDDGSATGNMDDVRKALNSCWKSIREEFDFIKTAAREYEETK